ncbi:DUF4435 domain-containing protein [Massilia putida]|uniref:DUF4435 domain-containing protein n=1 Tax=Massilia putida TaxID=1141883 RepID=UPI0009530ECF|nr:DUF4435 domain-containing protein [Massilia putida]
MSKLAKRIADIKSQQIGITGKRALVVEGKDDVGAFSAFLRKRNGAWDQQWVVAYAGAKTRVPEILQEEPTWIGVVDRDEWTLAEVGSASAACSNLFVLPRFCVESYLVDPAEIWAALPPIQRARFNDGAPQLRQAIEANLANWKRHAALWHVIHPIYRHMRSSEHRDSLLDPTAVPNDATLTQIVSGWLNKFDAARIAQEVNQKLLGYEQLQPFEFYHQHLYAKKFYPMVVHDVLNRVLGQTQEEDRWQKLLLTMPLPADLAPLWTKMGL